MKTLLATNVKIFYFKPDGFENFQTRVIERPIEREREREKVSESSRSDTSNAEQTTASASSTVGATMTNKRVLNRLIVE